MPLHQNQDGTWQWGKSGKKYKKKQDAVKQMKAIFANGYVEKKASCSKPFVQFDTVGLKKVADGSQTFKKGDSIWAAWKKYKKQGGSASFPSYQAQFERLNGLKPGASSTLTVGKPYHMPDLKYKVPNTPAASPAKTGSPVVTWTAKENKNAAQNARFLVYGSRSPLISRRSKLYKWEKPVPSVFQPYSKGPWGELLDRNKVKYNAIAATQSRGDRYTSNGKAAGPWQVYPGTLAELKKFNLIPQNTGLNDLYQVSDVSNTVGPLYYDLINKKVSDPVQGYMRYYLGPGAYKKLLHQHPQLRKIYPTQRDFAYSYNGEYHPKLGKKVEKGRKNFIKNFLNETLKAHNAHYGLPYSNDDYR